MSEIFYLFNKFMILKFKYFKWNYNCKKINKKYNRKLNRDIKGNQVTKKSK